jgi:hypothetical protein
VGEVLAARRAERERLIGLARGYVERLSARVSVLGAAVVGSVARGDFNVWSDVDVVVVSDDVPEGSPTGAPSWGPTRRPGSSRWATRATGSCGRYDEGTLPASRPSRGWSPRAATSCGPPGPPSGLGGRGLARRLRRVPASPRGRPGARRRP